MEKGFNNYSLIEVKRNVQFNVYNLRVGNRTYK